METPFLWLGISGGGGGNPFTHTPLHMFQYPNELQLISTFCKIFNRFIAVHETTSD